MNSRLCKAGFSDGNTIPEITKRWCYNMVLYDNLEIGCYVILRNEARPLCHWYLVLKLKYHLWLVRSICRGLLRSEECACYDVRTASRMSLLTRNQFTPRRLMSSQNIAPEIQKEISTLSHVYDQLVQFYKRCQLISINWQLFVHMFLYWWLMMCDGGCIDIEFAWYHLVYISIHFCSKHSLTWNLARHTFQTGIIRRLSHNAVPCGRYCYIRGSSSPGHVVPGPTTSSFTEVTQK